MSVIVTVTLPVVAVLLAVSVSVLVVLLGLNDAVTPLGRPDAACCRLPQTSANLARRKPRNQVRHSQGI
ncbi:MAG: hypothetical protein DMG49_09165 [Acidobacteria bacterium]|nr:MAG: hypothetical protein DMG49_09165 [Acidobacteriota bacterium]